MALGKHIFNIFLDWIYEILSMFKPQIEKHYAYKRKNMHCARLSISGSKAKRLQFFH